LNVIDAEPARKLKLVKQCSLQKAEKNKSEDTAESKRKTRTRRGRVKFCPKCGSTDVFWASGLPQLWSVWECRSCGYRGALILEDGKLAEKLREDHARKTVKS
jgi:predicted RNA-binding Zn-ribbon protein involved in translation (DUF1610 family)